MAHPRFVAERAAALSQQADDVAEIKAQLSAILTHLGIPPVEPPAVSAETENANQVIGRELARMAKGTTSGGQGPAPTSQPRSSTF